MLSQYSPRFLNPALGAAAILPSGVFQPEPVMHTSVLENVRIGVSTFQVLFKQFEGGAYQNSFNAFYGWDPLPPGSFHFLTAEESHQAIEAIQFALQLNPVDYTPSPDSVYNGFRLAFAADNTSYSYRTSYEGVSFPESSASESFTSSRNAPNHFSMAFLERTSTAVPEPSCVLILTLVAGGSLFQRRVDRSK